MLVKCGGEHAGESGVEHAGESGVEHAGERWSGACW